MCIQKADSDEYDIPDTRKYGPLAFAQRNGNVHLHVRANTTAA